MIKDQKVLLSRHLLLKLTREFFWNQDFLEIDTPILNFSLPHEANLYPFTVSSSQSKEKYFLPLSPEKSLKKTLSMYQKPLFSISKSFRDLESTGPQHLPEFTMLEFYTPHTNYLDTLKNTQAYLEFIFKNFQLPTPSWEILPISHLFSLYCPNIPIPQNEPDFNQLFLNKIDPHLKNHPYLFITHYPHFLSPLAQKEANSDLSERFECYIHGIEIANACTENTNTEQVKASFQGESNYRSQNNLPNPPLDSDFLKTLDALPPSSGCGLGLDRLLMLLTKSDSIENLTHLSLKK